MSKVTAASVRLAQAPQSLAELAAYVEYIAEVGAQKPELERAFEDVQAHFALCQARSCAACNCTTAMLVSDVCNVLPGAYGNVSAHAGASIH